MPDKSLVKDKVAQTAPQDDNVDRHGSDVSNDASGVDDIKGAQKQLDDLKKQAQQAVDPAIISSLLEQIKVLQDKLTKLEQLEEERKREEERRMLESLSETERLKYELQKKEEEIKKVRQEMEESFGKKAKELEEKLKKYEEEKQRLMQATAKARALEAASRLGAYNPEQVYALVRDYLVPGEDGEVYARVKTAAGDYVQQPLHEFLKEFLSRPENKNLLKVNAATGEGATPASSEGAAPKASATTNNLDAELKRFYDSLPPEKKERLAEIAGISERPLEDVLYVEYVKHKKAQEWRQRHMKK